MGKELQSSWLDEAAQNKLISPSFLHRLFQQKEVVKTISGLLNPIYWSSLLYYVCKEAGELLLKNEKYCITKTCTLIVDFTMASINICLARWYVGKTWAAWSESHYCTFSFIESCLLLSPPCLSASCTSSNFLPVQMRSSAWKLFKALTLMTESLFPS